MGYLSIFIADKIRLRIGIRLNTNLYQKITVGCTKKRRKRGREFTTLVMVNYPYRNVTKF